MRSTPIRIIVLCVDDEEGILSALQCALMENGYAVLVTNDGPKTLKQISGRRVDAIVLDYAKPTMNGVEVAVDMKQTRPDIPIVLFAESCDVSSSALAHVDAFVQKEEGFRSLLAILRQVLPIPMKQAPPVRRFPRFSVQLPVAVRVTRAGESAMLHGVSNSFGEGGLGGKINGSLIPGEYVQIRILDWRLKTKLEPRAQVRYRKDDTYGFAFLDVHSAELDSVRQLCGQLAVAP